MRISDWSSDVCSSDLDQYGLAKPHLIPLRVFSNAARLDGFTLHAGDAQGVLSGSRPDEVASLTIGGLVLQPGQLTTQGGNDSLTMVSADTQAAAMLKPDSSAEDRTSTRLNSSHKCANCMTYSAYTTKSKPNIF